jgi:transcriptional regulator with XRE-family HTH domain
MKCPLCKGTGDVRTTAEARPTTYIGRTLRNAREEAGFTLRDVELVTGLSNAAISQIETARIKNPSFHSLVNLCGVYGIPITSLITHIEGQKP